MDMLRFYNTLTKRKEVFRPLKKGEVRMYNCGPTIYDYAHIGNFRAYIFADLLRRYLEWKGFKVFQIMNLTDVGHMTEDDIADASGEDKIEKKAREQKKDPWEISSFFAKAFFEDRDSLNIKPATKHPKATDFVKEMIKIIEKLIKNGHAYESNGSVYYDISSFPAYGKLSGNSLEELKAGAGGRVEDNPDKKDPLDFALWKRDTKHIMQWNSPWGRGFPGWHIECSAMSTKLLGDSLDIHTGGVDNIFPHHECEIAQTEGATGKHFVRYWLHTGYLIVEGKKMSKSLGNFYTLRDLLKKGYDPMAVRYLLQSAHYRTSLNFTMKALKAAEKTLHNTRSFVQEMAGHKAGKEVKNNKKIDGFIKTARDGFEKAMDDDLGISDGLSSIYRFIVKVNKERDAGRLSVEDASKVYGFMIYIDRVLGLGLEKVPVKVKIPDGILLLVKERERLRKEKKFKEADRIRSKIKKKGFVIEDTPQGPKIRKA
jgi:cysteinyl-tRNA synthetase